MSKYKLPTIWLLLSLLGCSFLFVKEQEKIKFSLISDSLKVFQYHPKGYGGECTIKVYNGLKNPILFRLSEPKGIPELQPYRGEVNDCWVKELEWAGSLDPYYYKTDTLRGQESKLYKVYLNRLSIPEAKCQLAFFTFAYEKLSDVNENPFRNNRNYVYIPIFRSLDLILNVDPVITELDAYSIEGGFLFEELGFSSNLCEGC